LRRFFNELQEKRAPDQLRRRAQHAYGPVLALDDSLKVNKGLYDACKQPLRYVFCPPPLFSPSPRYHRTLFCNHKAIPILSLSCPTNSMDDPAFRKAGRELQSVQSFYGHAKPAHL